MLSIFYASALATSLLSHPINRILSVKSVQNGVCIETKLGAREALLQRNNAIRILSSTNSKISVGKPLDLIPNNVHGTLKYKKSSAEVDIYGPNLHVIYYPKTDRFVFETRSGKILLAEHPASRQFTRVKASHDSVLQTFEIQPQESFYGLGGHLRSGLDYRGSAINLEQSNRENAVLILVSSRGYALMMNKSCGQQVSIDANRGEIPAGNFLTETKQLGGLTADYYSGDNFNHLVGSRTDPTPNFVWTGSPFPGIASTDFSIKWHGFIKIPESGMYRLITTSDDGSRLFIDGKQLTHDWNIQAPTESSATVNLTKGLHKIKIEYFQGGGGAMFHFEWSPPTHNHVIQWKLDYANQTDYTFIYGPSFDQIIQSYRALTGRAPMFGKMGLWILAMQRALCNPKRTLANCF